MIPSMGILCELLARKSETLTSIWFFVLWKVLHAFIKYNIVNSYMDALTFLTTYHLKFELWKSFGHYFKDNISWVFVFVLGSKLLSYNVIGSCDGGADTRHRLSITQTYGLRSKKKAAQLVALWWGLLIIGLKDLLNLII